MKKPFRGSRDTGDKLSRLQQYLQAYSIALSKQKFARIYVDAFAGSGSRTETRAALPLFDGPEATPEDVDTPGSARIALDIDPPFDTLVLIERDEDRFDELRRLSETFPDRKVILKQGDANEHVQRLCATVPWHRQAGSIRGLRGVVFLDPFGMEVEWATVEAIGRTQALDCWYFFPLSGLYRNAPHDPTKLDADKQRSLDRVLGAKDWRERWYSHSIKPSDMFENDAQATVRADVDAIEAYVKARLETVFKGLVLKPLRLRHNGSNAPMASLFFAVSNPSPAAVGLASDIAGHILRRGNSSQV
jgi:three-Cys-motif partner protein